MSHDISAKIDPNSLLDTHALAAFLSLSHITLTNWRSEGCSPIPYIKIGRLVRYKYSDVLIYIESQNKLA
jgi:predicted DNA-binding transcriptional regulator AlpA